MKASQTMELNEANVPTPGPGNRWYASANNWGAQHFAGWNASLFSTLCKEAVIPFWEKIKGKSTRKGVSPQKLLATYMRLLQEAVGCEYIEPKGSFRELCQQNFLTYCFCQLLPENVPSDLKKHQELIVQLWNICENLLSEPVWMERYIVSQQEQCTQPQKIKDFLQKILQPVMTSEKPASWQGPFFVSTLDIRDVAPQFIPGKMYLINPRVLCIQDRRHPEVYMGVLLQHKRKKRDDCQCLLMGPTTYLGKEQGAEPSLFPTFAPGKVELFSKTTTHTIDLPYLEEHHSYAISAQGFLVVSAVDSQKLWIVETK